MSNLSLPIQKFSHAEDLPLPRYATEGSAGMDLYAATEVPITLIQGGRALIPCGIAIALPQGYEAQLRPRSGLALRHGVSVLNAPGTIDSDYRGELKALLINLGDEPFSITRGLRVAQLVVARYERISWVPENFLPKTDRGSGGFGSTGAS